MERKETRINKILKKEPSQRIHIIHTQFQDNIISYNNQDSVILRKGQTYRSMEQNREPRNRLIQIQSIVFWHSTKAIQQKKDCLFNKWWQKNQNPICKTTTKPQHIFHDMKSRHFQTYEYSRPTCRKANDLKAKSQDAERN